VRTRDVLRVLLPCVVMAAAAPLRAQSELPSTLSPAARDTLARLVDSVRVAGLPTGPLISRAAEGVLKRVSEERIILAVRALARRQAEARAALPPQTSDATLAAAVSALQAGVSPQTLRRLTRSAEQASESDLAVALIALADLVANQVPAEAAATSMEQLLERGASEETITTFRVGVVRDIQAGRAPDMALTSQTKASIGRLDTRPRDRIPHDEERKRPPVP
jgi:hypothetical protein